MYRFLFAAQYNIICGVVYNESEINLTYSSQFRGMDWWWRAYRFSYEWFLIIIFKNRPTRRATDISALIPFILRVRFYARLNNGYLAVTLLLYKVLKYIVKTSTEDIRPAVIAEKLHHRRRVAIELPGQHAPYLVQFYFNVTFCRELLFMVLSDVPTNYRCPMTYIT